MQATDIPNRDLLFEFCTDMEYGFGNMFVSTPAEQKISYMAPGSNPFSPVSAQNFAMLDVILVHHCCLKDLVTVASIREGAPASDHFLTVCIVCHRAFCRYDVGPKIWRPAQAKPTTPTSGGHWAASGRNLQH